MSRQAGSSVRGKAAPDIRQSGPAAGGGYVLRAGLKVKLRGTDPVRHAIDLRAGTRRLSWQEWQGSNLRPPVLETGALPIELHSCETLRHRRSAPFEA